LGTKHCKQQTEQSFGSIKIFKAMNGYLWIFFFFFSHPSIEMCPFWDMYLWEYAAYSHKKPAPGANEITHETETKRFWEPKKDIKS